MKHLILMSAVWLAACSQAPEPPNVADIQAEIKAVLAASDAAWSAGDIDRFMEDYWKSENLRFASGGNVNRGWQTTIDGYKARYPDTAAMGNLSYADMEIDVLSPTDALVFARWTLTRESAEDIGGLYTLHMKRMDTASGPRWLIVSDHTSSAD